MNRHAKKPSGAPTLAAINRRVVNLIHAKHIIGRGMVFMVGVSVLMVWLQQPLMMGLAPACVAMLLAGLYWRWSKISNQIHDAGIHDYPLTDAVDLKWMAWVADFEPRTAKLLAARRPDGKYRSTDFHAAYWRYAHDLTDLPKRAPYYGDTELAQEELELRRHRERRAAQMGE